MQSAPAGTRYVPGLGMAMLLEVRCILVTGAARGIRLAVAWACLDEGARVQMTDVDTDALLDTAKRLGDAGGRLDHHPLDFADPVGIDATLRRIARWDDLDGLVNNAAVPGIGDAAMVGQERWSHVLDFILNGAFRTTRASPPLLCHPRSFAIVNALSTQTYPGMPHSESYAAAKCGLFVPVRSTATDFGARGTRVNAIAPGFIDTRTGTAPAPPAACRTEPSTDAWGFPCAVQHRSRTGTARWSWPVPQPTTTDPRIRRPGTVMRSLFQLTGSARRARSFAVRFRMRLRLRTEMSAVERCGALPFRVEFTPAEEYPFRAGLGRRATPMGICA